MQENKKSVVLKNEEQIRPSLKLRILDALGGKFKMLPVIVALILIWVIFALIQPAFLSARNLTNLSIQIVNTAIAATGLFLLLLIGEIDLSVAATGAVCGTVSAIFSVQLGMPLVVCVLSGMIVGAVIGIMKGWIVTTFRAPAFIVTLGFHMALNGVLLMLLPDEMLISLVGRNISLLTTTFLPSWVSALSIGIIVLIVLFLCYQTYGQNIKYKLPASLKRGVLYPVIGFALIGAVVVAGLGLYKGVNLAMMILVILLLVLYYMCTQTRFGVHLYALGGNTEAVRRTGVNVKRTKMMIFIISGAVSGLSGIIAASRVQGVSSVSIDQDLQMTAVAAAVLGGASLRGGQGNVMGILLGALVMGSITNGLYLVGAPTELRYLIQGLILVLAIILDSSVNVASGKRG